MPELPSAEHISQQESKQRPLPIEPWVAAYLSRLWQAQKKHLEDTIASGSLVRPRSDQSMPASSHNHS